MPLSGAVLALPENIEAFTRPFISAYWAWSGSVEALQTQVHDAVKSVIDTGLSAQNACLYALGAHIGVALDRRLDRCLPAAVGLMGKC